MLCALALPPAAAPMSPIPWFHLKSRSVYCHVDLTDPVRPLVCWKPRTGFSIFMKPRGSVHTLTLRKWRHFYEDSSPVLRKGGSFNAQGFRCSYNGESLTCRNVKKRGFVLGPGSRRRVF
jgi:hypothetical protein